MDEPGVLTWSGNGFIIGMAQLSTTLRDFVTLWLICGCALGPLKASSLDGKTSSPQGKVGKILLPLATRQCREPAAPGRS